MYGNKSWTSITSAPYRVDSLSGFQYVFHQPGVLGKHKKIDIVKGREYSVSNSPTPYSNSTKNESIIASHWTEKSNWDLVVSLNYVTLSSVDTNERPENK